MEISDKFSIEGVGIYNGNEATECFAYTNLPRVKAVIYITGFATCNKKLKLFRWLFRRMRHRAMSSAEILRGSGNLLLEFSAKCNKTLYLKISTRG